MFCAQYAAHGGDGSGLGGARLSGNGSAAVGGGVAEALALLVTLGGRLPEPSCGKGQVRSAAVHSVREHRRRCGAHGCCAIGALLWRGPERALALALVHGGWCGCAGAAAAVVVRRRWMRLLCSAIRRQYGGG